MICPKCAAETKPGRTFCVRSATPLAAIAGLDFVVLVGGDGPATRPAEARR